MEIMIIRKFGVLSVAKVSGILYTIIGFVVGLLFSFISLVASNFGSCMDSSGIAFGALFGIGSVIFFPIFYGLLGFVSGAFMAWMYNIIVGWIGGVEIEFEDDRIEPGHTV